MLIAAKANPPAWKRHRWLFVATCILVAGFPGRPAVADKFDAFNVMLGGTVSYDSNVFRNPDSANPQSDIVSTGYVGLRIDKPYAQQRFFLDATATAYRYDKFNYLNFDGLDYRAAWYWHLTPRMKGTLSATRAENPTVFEETLGQQRNVITNENYVFNLDGWLVGGWHLLVGASRADQTSDQPFQATTDFRSVSGEAGIKYLTPSGNSITVTPRWTEGEYLHSIFDPTDSLNDNYNQFEGEFQANWILSGYSTVTGRLAWVERRHDYFPEQRDFSGATGDLGYKWTPTDKLSLEWIASRRIRPYHNIVNSYVVDDVLSFTPVWRALDKVILRMRLELVESDYRGGLAASSVAQRSDTTISAQVGADWMLLRSVTLGASLKYQERTSNNLLNEYDDTIAKVSASLMF